VRRGDHVLVVNFNDHEAVVPLDGSASEVIVGTDVSGTRVESRGVRLPAMAGALVK
jgi:hypothetical protein